MTDKALEQATQRAEKTFRTNTHAVYMTTNVGCEEFTFKRGEHNSAILHRRGQVEQSGREFPSWDAGR